MGEYIYIFNNGNIAGKLMTMWKFFCVPPFIVQSTGQLLPAPIDPSVLHLVAVTHLRINVALLRCSMWIGASTWHGRMPDFSASLECNIYRENLFRIKTWAFAKWGLQCKGLPSKCWYKKGTAGIWTVLHKEERRFGVFDTHVADWMYVK